MKKKSTYSSRRVNAADSTGCVRVKELEDNFQWSPGKTFSQKTGRSSPTFAEKRFLRDKSKPLRCGLLFTSKFANNLDFVSDIIKKIFEI